MENLKTFEGIAYDKERQEVQRWIKVIDEIEVLSNKHLDVYGEICDEHRKAGKYPSPECDERLTSIEKEMEEKKKIFQDFGIKFGCNDYDGSPCLSLKGMKNVLMVIFNIKEDKK